MLVPPVLLGAWATVYLWDVYEYATAPGVPVVFEYEGQGGLVKVRAESYAADVRNRLVIARGLEVHSPDGGRVIYVKHATVRQDDKGITSVEVDGVDVLLDRMPSGTFNFWGTIPKPPKEKGPDTSVRVVAKNVILRYQDRTRSKVATLVGRSSQVDATGLGDGWLAHGVIQFEQVGRLPFELVLGPGGSFQTDLKLANTQISPLLPVIERYLGKREMLPFSARSILASGTLQLDGKADAAFRAFGSVRLGVTDLKAADYQGSDLNGSLNMYGQRLTGDLVALGSGLNISLDDLAFDWERETRLYGQGQAKLISLGELPRSWRRQIPKDLQLTNALFKGKVGMQGSKWLVNGDASADRLQLAGERVVRMGIHLAASEASVVGQVRTARWNDVPLSGAFQFLPKSGSVQAFVESPSVALGPLAKKYQIPITGTGNLRAVISSGGRKSPSLWLASNGRASYALEDGKVIAGSYQTRLSGTADRLMVDQAVLRGDQGTLAVSGTISPSARRLDVEVHGGDIDATSFAKDLSGQAYFSGRVTGTFTNPQFVSTVDLYRLKYGENEMPWLQLHAMGSPSKVVLSDIEAQYGFSRVMGQVTVEPKTGRLSGNFRSPGIQLAEFGGGQAAGLIEILNGTVSGTLSNPRIMADLQGGTISYSGATLGGLQGRLFASRDLVRIAGGKLTVNDSDQSGDLDFTGQYRLQAKTGDLKASWDNLPLRPLAQFDERFAVQGSSTGTAELTFNERGPVTGNVSGSLGDVALNGQGLGSGPFEAKVQNGNWSASGSIGSIEQFASLEGFSADAKGNFAGRLTSYRISAESLIRLTRARWKDAPEDVRRFVADLTGVVDGTLAFSSVDDSFRLQANDLTVSDLSVGGRNVGKLSASLIRSGPAWQVSKLELQNGAERVSGKGSYGDDGKLNFEGEANKVNLSWLSAFNPDLAVIPAVADASILLDGTTENPHLQASLRVNGILRGDVLTAEPPPSVNLDFIELKDHQLVAEGAFQAQGFTGDVKFRGPLASILKADPSGRKPDDIFRLEANVAEREISEFKDLMPFLDFERSSGSLGGKITAQGNLDDYELGGGLQFGSAKVGPKLLAFKDVRTALENPLISLQLVGGKVQLNAQAESSAGGNLSLNATIPGDLSVGGDFQKWLASTPIQGEINLNGFKVDEGDPAKANVIQGAFASVSSEAGKPDPIRISGNLDKPLIAGNVAVSGANADLPEFKPGEGTFVHPVDPQFDISFASVDAVRIRTLAANVVATASGSVRGTLLTPQATGNFMVRDGTLKLPNARIQLEDGGLILFQMQTNSQGETTVEVPVSLSGRTSVSAKGPSSRYQRYDITIQVNGDLMRQGDLQLIGRSDPPDLSQQEILAIIGQRDLLEALATGAQNTRNGQFRDALIGLFLPTLSDQLTAGLASALNLDYLALDYNPFEGAMLSGAKSFGKYLTVEGRRAITQTPFINAVKYELRLVYRIPTQNPLLSRSRFVLSTDNLRPYRIAIEFSSKF